jgi:RecA/RadA recombinase
MSDIFKQLISEIDNEYAGLIDDGVAAGDVSGFIGTGSYVMNALLSGSIYGGLPQNKVTAFAGEPSVGKTFYALNVCKQFLEDNPTGAVYYFESESAISKDFFANRGIDTKRSFLIPVETIQKFRTQAVQILDGYMKFKPENRPPMLFVLDSLGNLSTDKEVQDIADGKDTRDMTRAQLVRGAFRVLTLKLGKAQVPLIVTNHVYDVVGSYVPMKKMGGGSGLEYAASTIVFLSKKKDKTLDDDNGRTGAVITAHLKKSRMTVEDKKVETWLNYSSGLDKYYGLLDLAEKYGIVKKVSTRYEFPNGSKAFEKEIKKNPEKFFTKDILDAINEGCQADFLYGKHNETEIGDEN